MVTITVSSAHSASSFLNDSIVNVSAHANSAL